MNIPLIIPRGTNKSRNVNVLLNGYFSKIKKKKPSISVVLTLITQADFSLFNIVIK